MVRECDHPQGSGDIDAQPPSASSRNRADTASPSPSDRGAMASAWWNIGFPPWLWAVRIRILFVIDGRITTGSDPEEFGLAQVLATLRYPWFAWWVRFSVRVVKRDAPESFRFTQDAFRIDDYDQVWFFGDWPGTVANSLQVLDDIIQNEEYSPLSNAELRIVAEWMERGGGVFATGDHSLLGASMCSRIPRVRRMRKWTRAQGVPPFGEEDRHQTLVRDPQTFLDDWEGDRWAQLIYPVYQHDPEAVTPLFEHNFPHPVLCGRTGVIERFPDHMHEGAVIEDGDVQLLDPLGIPGYQGEEFPVIEPVVEGAAAVAPETFGVRPRPHVIAHGLTTNPEAPTKRFALIGVYDGDPVHIGRVVVDSTWHHWFSMNLVGFQTQAPHIYSRMQDYYRNVALWLSTPEQRRTMLVAAIWGVLVGKQPEAFDKVTGIWGLGERALDVIGRTAPQCIVSEMVTTFLGTPGSAGLPGPSPSQKRRAAGLHPPVSMMNQAVVGGIAIALVDDAHRHIIEQARGQSTAVDVDAIRVKGLQGATAGIRELVATVGENATRLAALSDYLQDTIKRQAGPSVPISVVPVDEFLE